jgi:hypothetical protein
MTLLWPWCIPIGHLLAVKQKLASRKSRLLIYAMTYLAWTLILSLNKWVLSLLGTEYW